ncbi:MAG: GTPase domain-containing protein [Pirellulaceae bacterium]|nr:GTPase domain-containing protein [Pirellulaceae bacterium]
MAEGDYQHWVENITLLADAVRELEPLCEDLQVAPPGEQPWHGALFQHLLPQVAREHPVIIVAVAGGTNTGKSTIFNQLAVAEVSRTERFATKTKHPVCVVPRDQFEPHEVQQLFPRFEVRPWQTDEDATREAAEDLLFLTEDRHGHQSARLVLIDTPDIDGALPENWRRAELVRSAADVLVCALTEQKYNDDAVVRFFRHAGDADKTLIVVFNFVDWPDDRELCLGWLATFRQMTGAQPHYVYAAPRDREAAAGLRLPFYSLEPTATDLRRDLSDLKFTEIKMRSCRGSLRAILDDEQGLPRFLRDVGTQADRFAAARDILVRDVCVRKIELPRVPGHIIWQPVWQWLKPHRTTFDIWVHGFYNQVGKVVTAPFRASESELEDRFRAAEWESYHRAVQEMVDKLRLLRKCGNEIIQAAAAQVLRGSELEELFHSLKRAYDELPLVSRDFREHVDGTLEEFSRNNPRALKLVTGSLLAGAVVRPALTVSLACIPGAEIVAASAQTAATQAAAHAATHTIATVGIDVAAALGTNIGAEAAGQWSLTELLRGIFRDFYQLRAERLIALVHNEMTGPVLDRLDLLANVASSPRLRAAERAAGELRGEMITHCPL